MSALTLDRPRRVALLGCGNVGGEVARRLLAEGARLGLHLASVLVRDEGRDRGVCKNLLTRRFADVLNARPDVVVEVLGGVEPAHEYAHESLRRGIPVVTANKTLIARHGGALHAAAASSGAALAYEASVGGAIPVIAALRQLEGDRVLSIRGIVNGTCNFILTRMESQGVSLAEALAEAQRRGLAEPDPSADVSGRDSAEKLCVLAAAAGSPGLTPEYVACTGIEAVTAADIAAARRNGQTLRLVAEVELHAGGVRARVGPTILPRTHALAAAREEQNAVVVTTELAGELVFQGRGAGPRPTASAILGDVVRVARGAAGEESAARSHGSALRAGPVGGTADAAPRRHVIRALRAGHDAGRVLDVLSRHGVVAEEVTLGREGASVRTAHIRGDTAHACARDLAGAAAAQTLVMPVVDAA